MKRKLIIAITGASGSIYAQLLMKELEKHQEKIDKVAFLMSDNARKVWLHELKIPPVIPGFFQEYASMDFNSPIASGSSRYDSMVIIPCSMGTMGRIAAGTSADLLTRAADVMLKEKRSLILVPRETPFNLIHLRNMTFLAEAGASIIPAIPSFYSRPESVEEVAMTVVDRVMAHLGFDSDAFAWGE